MSNDPELFLIKDDKEDLMLNFQLVKRPTLKFQSESIETLSSSSNSQHSQDKKEDNSNHVIEECQQICRIVAPKQADSESSTPSSTEKLKVKDEEEEDEDGFKTPTSLDHRISVATQCPPAPRKNKSSMKRKAPYYNNCHCRQPLDVSKEVESLFPTHHFNPLSDSQQSTKKVRREEQK